MPSLPSLKALHTFEAAARLSSFTHAAAELHVTQGAVSHQVRALEDELGVALFEREHRKVTLTPEGRRLSAAVNDGLTRIADAVAELGQRSASSVLSVSVSPSLATRWLVPRLDRFRALHPQLDLRISATDVVVDPRRERIDLCIRYGRGQYPGLSSTLLFVDEVFPVCHPRLLRGRRALREPDDLRHHVLLHDDVLLGERSRPDWRKWLRAARAKGVDAQRGPRFSHAGLALEAAVAGQGVALGRSSLVADDLARGRLVRPFSASFRSRLAYWLVQAEHPEVRERTRPLREWLIEEAGR